MYRKKVLFLFNATTHYYNLVLNKLDKETEYEIHIAVPVDRHRNVGAGVYQTTDNLKIPIHPLYERVGKYLGCQFPDINDLLWELKPEIMVVLEPYQWGLFWFPETHFLIRALGIKVILKSIPFQLPNYVNPFKKVALQLNKPVPSLKDFWYKKRQIINDFWNKWFYKYAYDAHVCYIEKAYEIFGTYGVPKESIFLTFNSPDTDLLTSINEKVKSQQPILPPNPHRLIHVGRLVDWKRVDLIIQAVSNLKEKYKDAELLVVGYGPQEVEWKECAQKLGVGDRIKFLGGVYDHELLAKYFQASPIYVLGGMGGLSINDAMCFERPILCSVCDGTEAHLVKDGFNGYYFNNGDANDLTKKIEQMWLDPDRLRQMGANSYSIIKNEINVSRVIDGYTKAFKYVLNK